uniref:HP n=1 Tax=Agave tequilana vitivirus 1 TaxID=2794429 RepID=A0A7T5QZF4_9VIRU|nr:HP [Agave tequilana vitivirus 1]
MQKLARLYSVRELIEAHNAWVLGFSDIPLGVEVAVRSVCFTSLCDIVPTFLAWHSRSGTQKYTYHVIGRPKEFGRRAFDLQKIINLLEFSDYSLSNLVALVSFVGDANVDLISYSAGQIKNRWGQRIMVGLTPGSLGSTLAKIKGLIVLLD